MKLSLSTLAILGTAMTLNAMAADSFTVRSGPKQVAVVELFSSEGCSSCPPADRWLSALEKESGLWREFVPLAFQVDYWDNLGWKDRFASKENTERQVRYSELGRSANVYTPEFVLNGAEWRSWGRASGLTSGAKADAGVLEVQASATNRLNVAYEPAAGSHGDWDVTVAWVGSNLVSEVARGENAGRKLPHNFVVLRWSTFRLKQEDGKASASFVFGTPSDAGSAKLALAAWVTRRDDPVPVQAAGGWWVK